MDDLFQRLRPARFAAAGDPNKTPLEGTLGGDQIGPSGWYAGHAYSSFIGAKNLLVDPSFETALEVGVIGTSATAVGPEWTSLYSVVSGASPANVTCSPLFFRHDVQNTLNSDILAFTVAWSGAGTAPGTTEVQLYQTSAVSVANVAKYGFVVAGIKLQRPRVVSGSGTVSIYVDIQEFVSGSWTTRATSQPLTFSGLANLEAVRAVQTFYPLAAGNANSWRARYRIVAAKTNTGAANMVMELGEPLLAFSYTADAPPWVLASGTWWPKRLVAKSLLGESEVRNPDDDVLIKARRSGDTSERFKVGLDSSRNPYIELGPGTSARDLRIRRTGASLLSIDNGAGGAADLDVIGSVIADDLDIQGPAVIDDLDVQGPLMANVIQIGDYLAPSPLTGNTDNWAPTGVNNYGVLHVTSSSAVDLTGIQAPSPATLTIVILINSGSFTITLKHDNAGSTAANRFYLPQSLDMALPTNGSALLLYDTAYSRWRAIGN